MQLRAKGRHRAGDGIWLDDDTPLSPLSRVGRGLLGTGVALALTAGVTTTVLLAVDDGESSRETDRIAGSTDLDLSDPAGPDGAEETPPATGPSPTPEASRGGAPDPARTTPGARRVAAPAAVPAGHTDTTRAPRPAAEAPRTQPPPRTERPTRPGPSAERPWERIPGKGKHAKPGWDDGRWQWDGDRDHDDDGGDDDDEAGDGDD
ncbi:hypothetical protein AB0G74_03975 [Streptomyces sp. NPDC020875]|uniref:hypothetical protein n=1 Tax=Streptomyces sp. NPDC020875 TaxID=3154898 RepID=UPI0033FFA20E